VGNAADNLIVVICGSAASWMIAKVLRDRGGLHNRRHAPNAIASVLLHETAVPDLARHTTRRRQILELTMAVGGIPTPGLCAQRPGSAAQNIDAMFFAPQAPLYD